MLLVRAGPKWGPGLPWWVLVLQTFAQALEM
jgi:hypothetical protein